jgi:hypothetical protein
MNSLKDNAYIVALPERLHGYNCNRNRFLFAKVKDAACFLSLISDKNFHGLSDNNDFKHYSD